MIRAATHRDGDKRIAAAMLAAGCGSPRVHYRLSATRACLEQRGFRTELENNWLLKPSEGSLLVIFGRGTVVLEFGSEAREADRMRDAAFEVQRNWPIAARSNVAYVWDRKSMRHVAAVLDCLRG
jgi:hypothetical protein